jgi:chemotaxis response regulator CheB
MNMLEARGLAKQRSAEVAGAIKGNEFRKTLASTLELLLPSSAPMSKLPRTPLSKTRARLLVVDANTVCREGIRAIISRDNRFDVCEHTDNRKTVADLVSQHNPDLLLIDPFVERRDGLLLIKELAGRFRQMRILVVSQQPEEVYAQRILHAGASGYWMKKRPGRRAHPQYRDGPCRRALRKSARRISCGSQTRRFAAVEPDSHRWPDRS